MMKDDRKEKLRINNDLLDAMLVGVRTLLCEIRGAFSPSGVKNYFT